MMLNPRPSTNSAVVRVMQLLVPLMPSGLLYSLCNDCGPIRAYPVELRILRRVVTKARL